jgi:GntR family transcriptional regulator/MocR family aminotransferase
LADFIAEGHFTRHIRAMRALYQERQAALIAATQAALDEVLEVAPSAAGMHLVGWLTPTADDRVAAGRAAQAGVEVRPLSIHALRAQPRPGLLLGYTAWDAQHIHEGVRRLAHALRDA